MAAGQQHYTGREGREYHERKRGIPAEAAPWVARARAAKLQPLVRRSDVVFEYGVGAGWNLARLECREKIGFDVTPFLAGEAARHGIRFLESTSGLAGASVDRAICHHTLEHVISPPEALMELGRILKPDGALLLFVPFEKERRYRGYKADEPNHHLYSWNVQTLGNLVTECGWRVERAGVGTFGYDRFAAAAAVRLRLGEPGFRLIRAMAHLLQPGLEVRVVARPGGIAHSG